MPYKSLEDHLTLSSVSCKAHFAFKDLMIHLYLQFTLLIAACCVLHRNGSQDIHCQKLLGGILTTTTTTTTTNISFSFFFGFLGLGNLADLRNKRLKKRERRKERIPSTNPFSLPVSQNDNDQQKKRFFYYLFFYSCFWIT